MRRDNASNYLTRLIAAARRVRGRWKPGAWVPLDLIGDSDLRRLNPDTDPKRNAALRAAFTAFDLDPSKPEHWRVLLALFAEAYFVSRRPRGGTKHWSGSRLCQLLADFAAIKKKKGNQKLPDGKICEHLKTDFPNRYRGVKAVTLRRKLQDARDPDKNEILGDVFKARPADPRGMTAEEKLAYVIELISKQWKSG
jgi:hypothetical protein